MKAKVIVGVGLDSLAETLAAIIAGREEENRIRFTCKPLPMTRLRFRAINTVSCEAHSISLTDEPN